MGEDMVAVMVRLPGKPGIDRSERSAMQVTVAVTDAGVPTGTAKPLVSTSTRCAVQRTPWFRKLAAAPETPLASAWPWGRAIDADRAASAAEASTACRAIAIRPAAMINS